VLKPKSLKINSLYGVIDKAFNLVSGFILLPFVLHKIGADLYGIWIIFISVTGYFTLAQFGVSASFKKYIAEDIELREFHIMRNFICTAFYFLCLVTAVLVLCAMLFSQPVFKFLLQKESELIPAASRWFVWFLFASILTIINEIFSSVPQGFQRFDITSLTSIISRFVYIIVVIISMLKGYLIEGLIASVFISNICNLILNLIICKHVFPMFSLSPVFISLTQFKRMFSFGLKVQVTLITSWVIYNIDKLIISKMYGSESVTIYEIGARLVLTFREFPYVLFLVLMPYFSNLNAKKDKAALLSTCIRSTRYLTILCSLFAVVVYPLAPNILHLWIGPDVNGLSVYILKVLLIGSTIQLVTGVSSSVLKGIGKPEIETIANVILASLNVVLSFTFVKLFGIKGAAVGTTLSMMIGGTLLMCLTARQLKVPVLAYLNQIFTVPVLFSVILIFLVQSLCFVFKINMELNRYISAAYAVSATVITILFYHRIGFIDLKKLRLS